MTRGKSEKSQGEIVIRVTKHSCCVSMRGIYAEVSIYKGQG